MREKPYIIKAINALRGASFDEPINAIPFLSERMAQELVDLGYATSSPYSKDRSKMCYRVTQAGIDALNAKAELKPSGLKTLDQKLTTLPNRLNRP